MNPNQTHPSHDRGRQRLVRGALTTLVVGAVAGALAAIGAVTEPYGRVLPQPTLPIAVAVTPVRELDGYEVVRELVGVVEARRESPVGFELGGEVAEVLLDEGEPVAAGEVIARLDTTILEAERSTLLATREEARAATDLAASTRVRVERAFEKQATSAQSLDEAAQEHRAREATLARAEAAIRAMDARISKAEILAPFDALVAERFVDEGQVVGAGAPVYRLLERVAPEVRIGVPGSAVDVVEVGERYALLVRNRRIEGEVKAVLPVRGNGTRSVDVILTLDTELDGIRRGDLATLELAEHEPARGFWLPLTALTESSRGLWACYVAQPLTESGAAEPATHRLIRRELEVLHQMGDTVFVRGTLGDGESVVSEGLHRLVPEQLVRIAGQAGLIEGRERS